ncbi:MAG: YitT family protein [Firmicutes bacterium]|nr:YitT family protein [Bacillota bacterium]
MENTAENKEFLHPAKNTAELSSHLLKLPRLLLFLAGNAFVAYSYQGFVSANDFVSGGTYGLSGILTHFLTFIPFPLAVLMFNIPCMIWAWKELDRRFVIMTTIALLLQVFFLNIFQDVVIYNKDQLLAAIFAGVFVGLGDGLVLRSGSGSSGTHLVAMILHQKLGISVSSVTTSVNGIIILLSSGIFGIEKALYTLILIFASGQTLNAILDGISRKRTAFIVTTKGQEVGAALMAELHRGVTLLPAIGLYSQTHTSLLLCTTNMLEVGKLKSLVLAVDPAAFITFYTTSDISGHFHKHNLIVDKDEEDKHPAAKPQAPPPKPEKPDVPDIDLI